MEARALTRVSRPVTTGGRSAGLAAAFSEGCERHSACVDERVGMRLLHILLLCALAGCASGMRVEAKVSSSGSPVPNATVSMDCPQAIKAGGPSALGTTDPTGMFVLREPAMGRWIHDGCALVVSKPGYDTKRFGVENVCRAYEANHCTRAVVVADLAPATPTGR